MTNRPKNPWGNTPQNNNKPTGGGKPPSDVPDLDELLRKAKENFNIGNSGDGDNKKMIVIALLLMGILWIASGLYRVEPSENAVIQRFGNFSRTQTESGMGPMAR